MEVILDDQCNIAPIESTPISGSICPYHQLLIAYGYKGHDAPVADLLKRYHGLSGHWLVLSPVHWQATHNDAMIVAAGSLLGLTDEASRGLCSTFAEFLAEDGSILRYHDQYTWLLQTKEPAPDESIALNNILNRSIRPFLDALKSTPFWLRFITESQLFFNTYAQQKETRVNGLWVWGAGQLRAPESTPLVLCSEDQRWIKLCEHLSTQVTSYHPNDKCIKNSVFFVEKNHAPPQLEPCLVNEDIHWYWRNQAYAMKRLSWLQRLWRR